MIKTGRYYVMYNHIHYIDEHNIETKEVTRLSTSWSTYEFNDYDKGYVKLLSMTIDFEYLYILYNIRTGPSVGYYVNKFNHDLEFVEKIKINNIKPNSITSDIGNLYMTYKNGGTNFIALVSESFEVQKSIQCNITDIFGYRGTLYGFERGTIQATLYSVNFDSGVFTKIRNAAQKNGPDYSAQRSNFYGYSYPGYLSYSLETGLPVALEFTPKYNNYILGTISSSDGIYRESESITFSENMFFTVIGKITYPATTVGDLQEQSGVPMYENFAPNDDLYTGR